MKYIFSLITLIVFISCRQNQPETKTTKSNELVEFVKKEITTKNVTPKVITSTKNQLNETDTLFIDSTNFKYKKIDSFDLRNMDWGQRDKELKFLTKKDISKYFQNSELDLDTVYEENHHFYSLQINTEDKKVITLIVENEVCCADLHLLIYDKNNKLISNNIVAGTGGDGGWYFDSYGYFTNDSTYTKTTVDRENITENELEYKYKIDSVITKYRFNKQLEFKKIDEQKFQKTVFEENLE
jgi:hypothetical protein